MFATGRTILELLGMIQRQFTDSVYGDYTFSYLHLSGCRLLDGRNLRKDVVDRMNAKMKNDDPKLFSEEWQGLGRSAFAGDSVKYQSIAEFLEDMLKLDRSDRLESEIPELNSYEPRRVQSSATAPATFTYRVKKLAEHPLVSRLKEVKQLGLSNHVFPTASHSRLEHSLGVYGNACEYVRSLYHDPYNPLFRQVMRSSDIRAILAASILHDIGHYPFAHEMEDIPDLPRHENITMELIGTNHKDQDGHTLRDILENHKWGWGVSLESVVELLTPNPSEPGLFDGRSIPTRIASSIISGPVDIDKLDYLARDSHACYLPYGNIIDHDRLIRNLTIIARMSSEDKLQVELGIYERGQSAAESLTFARYLLYRTLYWHHTVRAIRAMLREAAAGALTTKDKKKKFVAGLKRQLGLEEGKLHNVTSDMFIAHLKNHTNESGKELLKLLRQRRFYKRILTIHNNEPKERGKDSLLSKFQNAIKQTGFRDAFRASLSKEFSSLRSAASTSTASTLLPEKMDKTVAMLKCDYAILLDVPTPTTGGSSSLQIAPEPNRMQRSYDESQRVPPRVAEVWEQVFHPLMRTAAKGRVFCHPDIRDTLMAVLSPSTIEKILVEQMCHFV